MVKAALACVVCLIPTSSSSSLTYRYDGIVHGVRHARVELVSASLLDPAGHAAVWLDVQTANASTWVQGGVAKELDGTWIYVETGRNGRQTSLRRWPAALGELVDVRSARTSRGWVVWAGGHRSRAVRVRSPRARLAAVETYGDAIVTARIGSRLIHAP